MSLRTVVLLLTILVQLAVLTSAGPNAYPVWRWLTKPVQASRDDVSGPPSVPGVGSVLPRGMRSSSSVDLVEVLKLRRRCFPACVIHQKTQHETHAIAALAA